MDTAWRRDKPSLELRGDGDWDERLVGALALDFDVYVPLNGHVESDAVVVAAGRATYRGLLAGVRATSAAPVVVLMSEAEMSDLVGALEHGADDVLPAPFEEAELLARLRALMRRVSRPLPATIRVGDLELDLERHTARRGARSIALSRTEFALLTALARRGGAVVSHGELAEEVWGMNRLPKPANMHTFISYVRGKIADPDGAPLLRTVKGVGYALRA